MNIVWGLIFILAGIGLMIYSRKWVQWFGVMTFFEQKFGSGGTYTGLRLMGLISVFVGMLVMFSLVGKFFAGIAGLFGFGV